MRTDKSNWPEPLVGSAVTRPVTRDGKKLLEFAEQEGIYETYQTRQADVADFWKKAEEEYINPVLETLSPELRNEVISAIHTTEEKPSSELQTEADKDDTEREKAEGTKDEQDTLNPELKTEQPVQDEKRKFAEVESHSHPKEFVDAVMSGVDEQGSASVLNGTVDKADEPEDGEKTDTPKPSQKVEPTPLELAIKEVKAAYIAAKKAYRISQVRREAIQDALNQYLGTNNFYNYTIQKSFKEASAKRVIRSFKVGSKPIIINNTEWLSLKVHGQSFMMHQIRKMIAMAALVVRCGTGLERMRESYGPDRISIPKAPGLGLLLERPVFETYNSRTATEFSKYEKLIDEFKQRQIYERIFTVENEKHEFHSFFHHVDNYRTNSFLWVTAGGIKAAKQFEAKNGSGKGAKMNSIDSDDEGRKPGEEEG